MSVGWVLIFALSAGAMVGAGTLVADAGRQIAIRTRLGQVVVGALLLGFVTSLPEMVTNASAALANQPSLAIGSVFGSCMANMAILAVLDLLHRGRLLESVQLRQARLAAVAMLLTAVAVLGIVQPSGITIGWIGVYPLALVGLYVLTLRWLRSGTTAPDVAPALQSERSLVVPVAKFAIGAVALLVAAPIAVHAATRFADAAGISKGFVGVALVALATSLPELFTSLAALRLGAYDLAVGNLLGSNSFNIASILVADAFFTKGAILNSIGNVDVIAGLVAIVLMAIAAAAIVGDPNEERRGLDPGPLLLLGAYGIGIVIVGTAS